MAVYARGYRPYVGTFTGRAPASVLFGHGFRTVFHSWTFRILAVLVLIFYVIFSILLYTQLNVQEFAVRRLQRDPNFDVELFTVRFLRRTLVMFYSPATLLGALTAMLAGAGLVADDLRSRALSLYLVRPIRPLDYALGKAFVLPALLALMLLLPGVSLFLFAALWQPSGHTLEFVRAHLDVLGTIVQHFLTAALGFTGLMLLLSARTQRRGSVIGWSAAVFFVGTMLGGLGGQLQGTWRLVLKHVSLVLNAMAPLVIAQAKTRRFASEGHAERIRAHVADPTVALWIAALLFVLGVLVVLRRARTTEVSG